MSTHRIKSYPRPDIINNGELLKHDIALDPENVSKGLELKENLLEHHDFEALNKKIYDLFLRWYGADFEICRVLKPDPFHGSKPFLELYPSTYIYYFVSCVLTMTVYRKKEIQTPESEVNGFERRRE